MLPHLDAIVAFYKDDGMGELVSTFNNHLNALIIYFLTDSADWDYLEEL